MIMGRYRSGQTGETVNLLAFAFSGSNPLLPNCQSRIVVDCAGFVNRIRKDTSVRIRSLADFAPIV